ncbi:MAG: MerR family transcriptional regulator [Microbacteriaceae bacterium]|jgi:molybdopterin-binding protein|nr:MerR family transcriptional regulator [Microbacteriaceae bacterium]HEV7957188.1 TOBE domain-containing protein [Marisediminicola sp.]
MTSLRVSEAAALIGVSDDTIRRWADAGRLDLRPADNGRLVVDGVQLAQLAQEIATESPLAPTSRASTRNRITGIVTKITKDTVMAQVELQAGPFRLVSLISREAADELGLEVGTIAAATIKATSVGIALP